MAVRIYRVRPYGLHRNIGRHIYNYRRQQIGGQGTILGHRQNGQRNHVGLRAGLAVFTQSQGTKIVGRCRQCIVRQQCADRNHKKAKVGRVDTLQARDRSKGRLGPQDKLPGGFKSRQTERENGGRTRRSDRPEERKRT